MIFTQKKFIETIENTSKDNPNVMQQDQNDIFEENKVEKPQVVETVSKDQASIQTINDIIKSLEDISSLTDEKEKKGLRNDFSCLELELFSSSFDKIIVTCIGMLKSGKSTLVNLLANNNKVAKTGFGIDTTRRPALVIQIPDDEPEGIEYWYVTNEDKSKDEGKKMLNFVFSKIRSAGISSDVEDSVAHSATFSLTEENLGEILCGKVGSKTLNSEPLLVVIKVHSVNDDSGRDSLLSQSIMLLDTPGVDSANSEWTKIDDSSQKKELSPLYEWILENSDLLLFVQSNVAPINEKAVETLEYIKKQLGNTPIWLIANEMGIKEWIAPQYLKREIEKVRDDTRDRFKRFSTSSINPTNLGKAYTAYFESELLNKELKSADILEESSYTKVLDQLKAYLTPQQIASIRKGKYIGNIRRDQQALTETINNIIAKIDTRLNDFDALDHDYEQFKYRLDRKLKKVDLPINYGDNKVYFHSFKDELFKELVNIETDNFKESKYKYKTANIIVKKTVSDFKEAIEKKIQSVQVSMISVGQNNDSPSGYVMEKLEEEIKAKGFYAALGENSFDKLTQEDVKTINDEALKMSRYTEPTLDFYIKIDDRFLNSNNLTQLKDENISIDEDELKKNMPTGGFLAKLMPGKSYCKKNVLDRFSDKYGSNKPNSHFDLLLDCCERELKRKTIEWMEQEWSKKREKVISNFDAVIQEKKNDLSQQRNKIEADKVKLKDILQKIDQICREKIKDLA